MLTSQIRKRTVVLALLLVTGLGAAASGTAGTSHSARTGWQADGSTVSTSTQPTGIGWD
jgi:hypothetical protein